MILDQKGLRNQRTRGRKCNRFQKNVHLGKINEKVEEVSVSTHDGCPGKSGSYSTRVPTQVNILQT